MNNQSITILHFSNVTFDFLDGECGGSFSLVSDRNDLRFEWVPIQKIDYINNQFKDDDFRIIFRLCEVQEIERNDNSMKTVSLKFTLISNVILPFFHFHNSPHASISHMLEFLTFKNYFTSNKKNFFISRLKYTKPSFPVLNAVTASDWILYTEHMKIMKTLLSDDDNENKPQKVEKPLTLQQAKKLFNEQGQIKVEKTEFLHLIRRRGLTNETRYLLWPYLTDLYTFQMAHEEKTEIIHDKEKEYLNIKQQIEFLFEEQKEEVNSLSTMLRTISNDVKRTDRSLPQFKAEDSPYLKAVQNILTVYAFFNKDTDYVQGFGDLLTPIMLMCIKEWKQDNDDHVIMRDDTIKTRNEAEGYIFALFCAFMEKMQQDRLFYDLSERQEIVLDQVFMIISFFDKPFVDWYQKHETESLFFIYRPILLLFKREFDTDEVLTVWEYFMTIKNPYVFPRFFATALLLQIFPKLLFESDGSVGEAMAVTDKTIGLLSAKETLHFANKMRKTIGYKVQYAVEPLSKNMRYTDNHSKYLKL